MSRRQSLTRLGAFVLSLLGVSGQIARAQDYPSRPIKVVVTSSVGSTGDATIRILGAALEKVLGQPIVVENIPGSGGVAGTEKIVRAAPDGYTLGLISNNHAINPHIIRQIPYDSENDIAPISLIATTPVVLVTHPQLPARTTRELIDLAKAKPGVLNYGSAGNGTVLHLAGVLFTSEAGVDIRHVPYKGLSQMVADLLGGRQTARHCRVHHAPLRGVARRAHLCRIRSAHVPIRCLAGDGGAGGLASSSGGAPAQGAHDRIGAEGRAGRLGREGGYSRGDHPRRHSAIHPFGNGQARTTGEALWGQARLTRIQARNERVNPDGSWSCQSAVSSGHFLAGFFARTGDSPLV